MMMLNVISTLVIDMMLQKIYSSVRLELSSWGIILPLVYNRKEVITNVIQSIGKKELSERALATLYVGMGPVFSVFWGFDTPETHIRHVQNFILIAEMESAS